MAMADAHAEAKLAGGGESSHGWRAVVAWREAGSKCLRQQTDWLRPTTMTSHSLTLALTVLFSGNILAGIPPFTFPPTSQTPSFFA